MNRRWQADGIPLWRKLFSSNWWWYGEVNPDPTSLPPIENRPKFWRWDMIVLTCMILGMPMVFMISAELNSRHWPFNKTEKYVGRIVGSNYSHPQFEVELIDKTVVRMALPFADTLGLPRKKSAEPVATWTHIVDGLKWYPRRCTDGLVNFYAESWKFTFKPYLTIWEVSCAHEDVKLITREQILTNWKSDQMSQLIWFFGVFIPLFVICTVGIIRRERKLYVKS